MREVVFVRMFEYHDAMFAGGWRLGGGRVPYFVVCCFRRRLSWTAAEAALRFLVDDTRGFVCSVLLSAGRVGVEERYRAQVG